jgi:hypothetical protein
MAAFRLAPVWTAVVLLLVELNIGLTGCVDWTYRILALYDTFSKRYK